METNDTGATSPEAAQSQAATRSPWRRRVGRALLLGLGILALAELGARLFEASPALLLYDSVPTGTSEPREERYEPGDTRMLPGRLTCGNDSQQQRDRRRVALVGGSVAQGTDLAQCQELGSRLQERLKESHVIVDFTLVKQPLPAHQLVVEELICNYFDITVVLLQPGDFDRLASGLLERLALRSSLLMLLRQALEAPAFRSLLGGDASSRSAAERAGSALTADHGDAASVAARIGFLLRTLIFCAPPESILVAVVPGPQHPGAEKTLLDEVGPAVCQEEQLAMVDLAGPFRAGGSALLAEDQFHWSAAGHQLAADLLVPAILAVPIPSDPEANRPAIEGQEQTPPGETPPPGQPPVEGTVGKPGPPPGPSACLDSDFQTALALSHQTVLHSNGAPGEQ